MKRPHCFHLLGVLFGLTLYVSPQSPPTPEQALKSIGVDTSVPSLRIALQDPRSEVRGLAAALLAEKHDTNSVTPILASLNKATSPMEKLNLAQALIMLGEPEGTAATRDICDDRKAREDLRIIAASRVIENNKNGCINSVVEMLSETTSSSTRQAAMQLLLNTPKIPSELRPKLQVGLQRILTDQVPNNRQSASECLRLFKIVEASDSLKRAIAVEQNDEVHRHMQADFAELTKDSKMR